MKAAAVLARLFLCLALVAGGGVASAFEKLYYYSPELKQKAEQGYAEAQFRLGLVYWKGRGINKDEAEGAKWIHLAAEQGHSEAQYRLGFAYQNGYGSVEHDSYKAYIWNVVAGFSNYAAGLYVRDNLKPEKINEELKKFPPELQKKAKQSFVQIEEIASKIAAKAEANYNAGKKHEEGDGVLPNYKEAARLYGLSAEKGHTGAQYRLGLMYLNGKGVAQDYSEAYIWFALAALNADGKIKEEAIKSRQATEEKLTPDEVNRAQAEATNRLK